MANQANRESLQSTGGKDVYRPPPDYKKLIIAEEDPEHPNHAEHMLRVNPEDPENQALLASFRELGWPDSQNISAYKDGKIPNERWIVTNGRRRLTFVRIENERRLREKDPRGLLSPMLVSDTNPLLTESIANAMHKRDPPMVLGRRFLQLKESGLSPAAAAAAQGLLLSEANALAVVLGVPNAALHAAVNRREVPLDVAARAAKAGGEAVKTMLASASKAKKEATEAATSDAGEAQEEEAPKRGRGRPPKDKTPVDKAHEAARNAVPKRARSQNAERIRTVAGRLREAGGIDGLEHVCQALAWASGATPSDKIPAWLANAIEASKATVV